MSRWKQGDTLPPMRIDCFDANGKRVNLTTATLVRVDTTQLGVLKWTRTLTGDANGLIVVPLQASDTATPGTYYVKVYVEWPGGGKQHYPPGDEYLIMTVTR